MLRCFLTVITGGLCYWIKASSDERIIVSRECICEEKGKLGTRRRVTEVQEISKEATHVGTMSWKPHCQIPSNRYRIRKPRIVSSVKQSRHAAREQFKREIKDLMAYLLERR